MLHRGMAAACAAAAWAGFAAAELPRGKLTVERMKADLYYLSSATLEGRGISTHGVDLAAEHVRSEFKRLGLKSGNPDGSYFHYFDYGRDQLVDDAKTKLAFKGGGGDLAPALAKDYSPSTFGAAGTFAGPVAFAGYGITIEGGKYDDYKDFDVAGKVVLVIRKTPLFKDAEAAKALAGDQAGRYAAFDAKLRNAVRNKAAALLVVNDAQTAKDEGGDKLLDPKALGVRRRSGVAFASVSRAFADQLLAGTPVGSLAAAEAKIAETGKPASAFLEGRTAAGEFAFKTKTMKLKNVVGVIEGQGPHANETIVVGSHYDHVGYGDFGSLAPLATRNRIHHGADDNASGTTAMLETARRFKDKPAPARRLVFIAFSAEEAGLIGSREYVKAPFFPIKDTVAMFNFDMVGRLRNDDLEIAGNKSAKEWEPLLAEQNSVAKFKLKLGKESIRGDSDHASFSNAGIPVLFFFTGMHREYHTPADTADLINFEGMAKVADFCEALLEKIVPMTRPAFVKPPAGMAVRPRARLGFLPDGEDQSKDPGIKIASFTENSAAEKSGLKAGDRIVEVAGKPVATLPDIRTALEEKRVGDSVPVVVKRGTEKQTVTVKF